MDTPDIDVPPPVPAASAPPVTNRFLFVDIAALRAKQLRRGAMPRLDAPSAAHKPERVAMEEVRRGFVEYDVPGIVVPPEGEPA
jgi:DNA-directed RNA polymerase subunit K/omega